MWTFTVCICLFFFFKGLIVLLSAENFRMWRFVFGHFATLFDVDVRERTINYWERKRSGIGTWQT